MDGYTYRNGINPRAMFALVLGHLPVVPGFIRAATTPGGQVASHTVRCPVYLRVVCHIRLEQRRYLPCADEVHHLESSRDAQSGAVRDHRIRGAVEVIAAVDLPEVAARSS